MTAPVKFMVYNVSWDDNIEVFDIDNAIDCQEKLDRTVLAIVHVCL